MFFISTHVVVPPSIYLDVKVQARKAANIAIARGDNTVKCGTDGVSVSHIGLCGVVTREPDMYVCSLPRGTQSSSQEVPCGLRGVPSDPNLKPENRPSRHTRLVGRVKTRHGRGRDTSGVVVTALPGVLS